MSELVPASVSHLGSDDFEFFDKWLRLSMLEAEEAMRSGKQRDLWCKTPAAREFNFSAIINLRVKDFGGSYSGELDGVYSIDNDDDDEHLGVYCHL
jgi:hypothetical protein